VPGLRMCGAVCAVPPHPMCCVVLNETWI
jgi:hypothetical protein